MHNDQIPSPTRYASYLDALHKALAAMAVTDGESRELPQEQGLLEWCAMCHEAKQADQTMFFIGNGASAAMASHMAADFSKNCGCRAMAFNDVALMTAISNDIRYEECFAVPLARFANPGDLLVTVSSSGNSPNVVRAIETARRLDLKVITVSGMKADNRSRRMGDLNFWIPAPTYGLAEAGHQALLHCWLDIFLELYGDN
ncbi:SIS domain-containing protein [Solidesulfovibrio sp.]|uniref:SIS domain-containing protein n=1 Tax=Solidesulfovibrio sp. TaxID=2910990 RepID=UPI002628FF09|nr:SIS domain-containing protein [Solidesulfovibrio sp.]